MLQSFLHSLVESNALWLIWAAVGVAILGFCIVFASVVLGDSEEPLYRAASASRRKGDGNGDGQMIV
jgi:signal peptidase I